MTNESDKYEVGYRKPPKRTQFKPGTSGNPRGRPRQTPSFASDLAAELQQTLAIVEDGKRLVLTKQQAVFKMLTTAALKDVRAASVLLDIARRYGVGTEAKAEERIDAEEDAEIIDEYFERRLKGQDALNSEAKRSESGDRSDG